MRGGGLGWNDYVAAPPLPPSHGSHFHDSYDRDRERDRERDRGERGGAYHDYAAPPAVGGNDRPTSISVPSFYKGAPSGILIARPPPVPNFSVNSGGASSVSIPSIPSTDKSASVLPMNRSISSDPYEGHSFKRDSGSIRWWIKYSFGYWYSIFP